MSKRTLIGVVATSLIIFGIVGSNGSEKQNTDVATKSATSIKAASAETEPVEEVQPICDGTDVTSDCTLKG